MLTLSELETKYSHLSGHLNERSRRIWAATEALAIGYGGASLVSKATGISRVTIAKGMAELHSSDSAPLHRIRKSGGGRKSCIHHIPDLPQKVEELVEPLARGDPESPLRWTCKSTRRLAEELAELGIHVGRQTVTRQLHALGYSLQANRKTEEGQDHPDRNAQFEHINRQTKTEMQRGNPVISVDTKKKELVGNYKNNGQEWHKKGQAPKVQGHDFPDPDVPRAFPYGVYDLGQNVGFVNVGCDHDTSRFAVASIRAWWNEVGKETYPDANCIQIMADSGGSNGYRRVLWKWELQCLANETGLPIRVCHFPPGTSKWNKVEHRLFSVISQNWRGEPLVSYETIVSLISNATTTTGLKVHCRLDKTKYPLKQKISGKEAESIRLFKSKFHGEWNYKIKPIIE